MGVVHHSHYFVWYELGRIALADKIGINFRTLQDGTPLHFPVLECSCRYRASARFGDVVEVETMMVRPQKARIDFTYRVFHQKGRQLLTEATTSHALMRADTRQILMHLPTEMLAQLDYYFSQTQDHVPTGRIVTV